MFQVNVLSEESKPWIHWIGPKGTDPIAMRKKVKDWIP